MRAHRPSPHDDAVERRLDLLARELAAVRGGATAGPEPDGIGPDGAGTDELDPWDLPPPDDADAVPGVADRHPLAVTTSSVPRTPPASRAAVLPDPGRHASRRPGEGVRAASAAATSRAADRVWPPAVRGAFSLGAPHVAVLAAVVALGLALTTWWVVRADPGQAQAPASAPSDTGADPGVDDGADLVALAPVAAEPAAVAAPAGAHGGHGGGHGGGRRGRRR